MEAPLRTEQAKLPGSHAVSSPRRAVTVREEERWRKSAPQAALTLDHRVLPRSRPLVKL